MPGDDYLGTHSPGLPILSMFGTLQDDDLLRRHRISFDKLLGTPSLAHGLAAPHLLGPLIPVAVPRRPARLHIFAGLCTLHGLSRASAPQSGATTCVSSPMVTARSSFMASYSLLRCSGFLDLDLPFRGGEAPTCVSLTFFGSYSLGRGSWKLS